MRELPSESPMKDGAMGCRPSYSHAPVIESHPEDVNCSAFRAARREGEPAPVTPEEVLRQRKLECRSRAAKLAAATVDQGPSVVGAILICHLRPGDEVVQ